MKKYWKVWWTSALLSIQATLANRVSVVFFTLGKFLRFFLFIGFLLMLHNRVERIVGYSLSQMITFFLMFNLLDLFGQVFFRGIYWFRQQVISGEFDFRLVKPMSALFQALTRHTDILDVPLILVVLFFLVRQISQLPSVSWPLFLVVTLSGMFVVTAIHIVVTALGVITTEVDQTIMIYRDLSQMARVPIDIYTDGIRALLTFVIPIAIAFTFPAKALLGLLAPRTVAITFIASLGFLILSFQLWRYALTKYSSASS